MHSKINFFFILLMLRSFPENSQFHPNILGQQSSINHKIESDCVTSVILDSD